MFLVTLQWLYTTEINQVKIANVFASQILYHNKFVI
jgi:hypothetical protein